MQFGLFGSASARRGSGEFDSTEGYHDWIEYNVEAEALGFRSTFCVEHHFTGYGQVSATLNLLTWLGSRTKSLRLGTAVMVLPWHNPVLLAEQAATLDLISGGRLDFGIGSGYRYNEFAGFDVGMDEAREKFEELIGLHLREHLFRTSWRNVRKWRLIEQGRVHHSLICKLLDNHVDELDLRGRRSAGREEVAEGFLDRHTI